MMVTASAGKVKSDGATTPNRLERIAGLLSKEENKYLRLNVVFDEHGRHADTSHMLVTLTSSIYIIYRQHMALSLIFMSALVRHTSNVMFDIPHKSCELNPSNK